MEKQTEFLTLREFSNKHPSFSHNHLRWLMKNREKNGISLAIIKIDRRLMIDESKFFEWLDTKRGA